MSFMTMHKKILLFILFSKTFYWISIFVIKIIRYYSRSKQALFYVSDVICHGGTNIYLVKYMT